MRKWKEDEEIGRGMRKWTENEEMERDFLSIKQFPLFALKLLYYYIEICNFLSQKSVYTMKNNKETSKEEEQTWLC